MRGRFVRKQDENEKKPEEEVVEEQEVVEEEEKVTEEKTEKEAIINEEGNNEATAEEEGGIDVSGVPELIERVYAQLDAIRDILTEIAEAIRSGAEAQKVLGDVMEKMDKRFEAIEKKFEVIEKKIEEIAKVDLPYKVHAKIEREKYGKPKEPEATETAREVADEIASPERTANMFIPEYLQKAHNVVGKAVTPRPETDTAKDIMKGDEMNKLLKSVLEGKITAGELGEKLKKLFGGKLYS